MYCYHCQNWIRCWLMREWRRWLFSGTATHLPGCAVVAADVGSLQFKTLGQASQHLPAATCCAVVAADVGSLQFKTLGQASQHLPARLVPLTLPNPLLLPANQIPSHRVRVHPPPRPSRSGRRRGGENGLRAIGAGVRDGGRDPNHRRVRPL
jgi:hypothetical protein